MDKTKEKLQLEVRENQERLRLAVKVWTDNGSKEEMHEPVVTATHILDESISKLQFYVQNNFEVKDGVTLQTSDGNKYSYTIVKKTKHYLKLQRDKVIYNLVIDENGNANIEQHIETDYYGSFIKVGWDRYARCYCHCRGDIVHLEEGRNERLYSSKK